MDLGFEECAFLLLAWATFCSLGGYVASQKNRSVGEGVLFAFLLGPVGIIIEGLLPSLPPVVLVPPQHRRAKLQARLQAAFADAHDSLRQSDSMRQPVPVPISESNIRQLVRLLLSNSPIVRSDAAYAIGQAGANAISAMPWLIQLATTDENADVRKKAIQAIQRIDPDAARRLIDKNSDNQGST